MNQQEIEFLKTLTPPPLHWQGMGALKYRYDPRDWDVRSLPGVCEAIEAGLPASVDMTNLIQGTIYNQGGEGACVAFSTAGLCSMDDVKQNGRWEQMDAELMYHNAGGTGNNGVDTRLVLQQATDNGVPLLGNSGRVKILQSYAFVPQQPGVFTDTIKAALAAGYPLVLALLLPSDWGWQSGHGSRTSGYHQVVAVGYTADGYLICLNSWGAAWPGNSPHAGVGSVLFSFLEASALQNGYCYSYTVTPVAVPNPTPIPTPTPIPDPTPVPVPPPARQATVGGRAIAGASNGTWPKVGSTIPFGVDVALTIESIVYDGDPTPNPQPNPNPQPDPNPQPEPQPQPDAGIQVLLTNKPSQLRNTVSVIAYTEDMQGHSFPASVTGAVTGPNGIVQLPGLTTHGSISPAIWTVERPAPWGVPCQVTVTANNGDARGSATKPG